MEVVEYVQKHYLIKDSKLSIVDKFQKFPLKERVSVVVVGI